MEVISNDEKLKVVNQQLKSSVNASCLNRPWGKGVLAIISEK